MVDWTKLPPPAREAVESLQAEVKRLTQLLNMTREELRLLKLKRFGAKSEKLSDDQLALLMEELIVNHPEVEKEADLPAPQKQLPQARKPRARHTGRDPLSPHLERREVIIPCHSEDCRCEKCGHERPVIGYEIREELDCVPTHYFVRVIKREKRGSHCVEEQGVATAPAPAQIIPKSKLSNEFITQAVIAKFQLHLPVYRQCAVLEEMHGLILSRQTLNEAIIGAGDLLRPLVKVQAAELLAGCYIQADETTAPCQTDEKTGRNHQAYIWEYSEPGGRVVFDFKMGRGRDGPREFLRGFKGKLQSDGYGAYDKLGEGITYVACMSHIRRGFVDASKLAPKDPLPVEILARIGELYQVERQALEANFSAASRLELRLQQSVPVMNALKARILELRQLSSPASALAKACDYALGQWVRMEEYLKDGQIEIDNNWCENGMRPIALGRKNWLHIGSPEAGPKIAAIMSIVETCRRLDVPLREYLLDVLPGLGDQPMSRVAELTPRAWKSRQKA